MENVIPELKTPILHNTASSSTPVTGTETEEPGGTQASAATGGGRL